MPTAGVGCGNEDRAAGMPLPCPRWASSWGPGGGGGGQVLRRLREAELRAGRSLGEGWGQDSDSLRDRSLPLPVRWPIRGVSIWEAQCNSLPFNICLLSICRVPGLCRCWCCTQSHTELGTARPARGGGGGQD
uniref:Uncharacterized protein n=1 Tax=Myotis myotis TaxID=51298 RepID=A0A7J7VHS0_MYOMY|nr:hypothetical protein mMyoMyo1_008232 [Myotis myotis]